jgi:membrane fusion protein (multidrug efflux system)
MSDNAIGTELARADTAQIPGEDNRPDQTLAPTKDPEADTGQKYAEKHKADEAGRNKRRPLVITGGILVVVLLTAGGLFYWLSTRNLETTDDAYTDGRAIAIAPQV